MCGFIFVRQSAAQSISKKAFERALEKQSWRGPDASHIIAVNDGKVFIGHNRLAIIDPVARSDQPMLSRNGRYFIAFNGEIYNHKEIRIQLKLDCVTDSDTETILEGYVKVGPDIVSMLEGMFAFIIYDQTTNNWFSARDRFGIKPLYAYESEEVTIIGSEPAPIAELLGLSIDAESIEEWRLVRRPIPGKTFFSKLAEHPFAAWRRSQDATAVQYWKLAPCSLNYDQSTFESLLTTSVKDHELSDVSNVALLSGGLDSAVITALSNVKRAYSVGLETNNEINGARETADLFAKTLAAVVVSENEIIETWRELVRLRGEPLSVPNEALIYLVCKKMAADEKVVLTGEGADELLFGYDAIFRWASYGKWQGVSDFLSRYGYSIEYKPTDRLVEYIETKRYGKDLVEFLEDFFYDLHLPGLLRRMDFASMAASKEARVPFVDRPLVSYMYRRPSELKIAMTESKIPLRLLAKKLGLNGPLSRKKIGFSATIDTKCSRSSEYKYFQSIVLDELKW